MKLSHVSCFSSSSGIHLQTYLCVEVFVSVYWRRGMCVVMGLRDLYVLFSTILCLPYYIITTSAYQQSEAMPSEILYKSAKFTIALCRNSYCACEKKKQILV